MPSVLASSVLGMPLLLSAHSDLLPPVITEEKDDGRFWLRTQRRETCAQDPASAQNVAIPVQRYQICQNKKKSCGLLEIFEASTGDSSPLSCGGDACPHEGTHKFVFAITLHCTGQEVECQVDA